MSDLLFRAYHDTGLDRLVCRLRGHDWTEAGWRARACKRCPECEMWWEM